MAGTIRHSTRLLSPGEVLLSAFVPSTTCFLLSRRSPNVLLQQRQQRRTNKSARDLPSGFNLHDILRREAQGVTAREERLLEGTVVNEAIDHRWVVLRNEDTTLSKPQLLAQILPTIDRSTHCVHFISPLPSQPDTGIVQIIQKDELLKRLEAQKMRREGHLASTKGKPKGVKQIEVNWGIGEHDLGLKLKKLEEFLGKGYKVEVMMANKKKTRKNQKRASPEEASTMVNQVRSRLRELGAQELKWDGNVGGTATMMAEMPGAAGDVEG